MKKIGIILVSIVGLLLVLGLLKDQIIKATVMTVGSQVVGAPIKIGSFSLGLMNQSVKIENFQLYNPPGFPSGILVDIPLIQVEYDLAALMQNKLHLRLVALDLKEVVIVEDKDGKLNIDALKVVEQTKQEGKQKPQEKKPDAVQKELPMQIDVARINLGRVVHKKLQASGEPIIQAYDANIKDKEFKDIKSAQQLAVLILLEATGRTAIKNAAIYGAANVLGVAFLPAGIAAALMGDANSAAEVSADPGKAYQTSLGFLKEKGQVTQEDQKAGVIKGKSDGHDVVIKITSKDGKTSIEVTAKKMLLPKPQVAGGILYQITERLK